MRSSFLVLTGAVVVAACSSSSSGSAPAPNPGPGEGGSDSGGSSGAAPPTPDGFIAATVGPGSSSPSTVCNLASVEPWLDVGTPTTTGKPVTVPDGGTQSGATVNVSCTVTASGSGFDVSLSIEQQGTEGSTVTITSQPGEGVVTLTGGHGITGVFQSGSFGTYRASDCTLAFTYAGSPVQAQPPIAAGRIWGHISCPAAQISGETTVGPDGGTQDIQCDAEADFLFEQCGQ